MQNNSISNDSRINFLYSIKVEKEVPLTFKLFDDPRDVYQYPSIAKTLSQLFQQMDIEKFYEALPLKRREEGYRLSAILDQDGNALAVAGTRPQLGVHGSSMLDLQHFAVDKSFQRQGLGSKLLELTKQYYIDHLGQKPNSGFNVTISMDSMNRNNGLNQLIYTHLGGITDMVRVHIPTNQQGKLLSGFAADEKQKNNTQQQESAQKQIGLWTNMLRIAQSATVPRHR